MKAAARWYLAAIAMMTLVLVAIHFAMQVQAQEEAKRLVAEWQKRTGIQVGDVRYRMLRGALTLIDVRYVGDGVQAYLPLLFLQGSLTSLSSQQPLTEAVEIRGGQITMTPSAAMKAWSNPENFFGQMLSIADSIGIYQSRIDLLPEASLLFPALPTRIELIRMERIRTGTGGVVRVVAGMLGGEMTLNAVVADGGDKSPAYHGGIYWHGMDATRMLTELAGLPPVEGSSSGGMSWDSSGTANLFNSIDGSMDVADAAGKEASLRWQGTINHGRWKGKIDAEAWPLAMFAGQLPQFQRYSVADGRMDASLDVSGDFRHWSIGMKKGHISSLLLRRPASEERNFPGWRISVLQMQGVELKWPARQVTMTDLKIEGGTIVMDAEFNSESQSGWQLGVEKIDIDRLAPGVALADKQLLLPAMRGEGKLARSGTMKIHLESDSPSQRGSGRAMIDAERWVLKGEGNLYDQSADRFAVDVQARHAPLVRFRPLMPDPLRSGGSNIVGDVSLNLRLLAGGAPWAASGAVKVNDASLQYEGDSYQADKVSIDVEQIGTSLPRQLIRSVEIDGWQYQAALKPLIAQEMLTGTSADEYGAEPWHIRKMTWKDGTVSVGQVDAIWLDAVRGQATDLYTGNAAPFSFDAELDGGHLSAAGSLGWNTSMPEIGKVKMSLQDARPFFANEWLTVSGAPKIVRGRLYADITMQKNEQNEYTGMGYLRLQNGQLGPALSASDPLLLRIGMNSHDIFAMLRSGNRFRLGVPIHGEGSPLRALGQSFVEAIRAAMAKREFTPALGQRPSGKLLASVRLHEVDALSQNERSRLRDALGYMKKNPKSSIELRPQLSLSSSLEEQVARVRYTQQLIEEFLNHRGVDRSRIFPVWPLEQHRSSGSTSGVNVMTIP